MKYVCKRIIKQGVGTDWDVFDCGSMSCPNCIFYVECSNDPKQEVTEQDINKAKKYLKSIGENTNMKKYTMDICEKMIKLGLKEWQDIKCDEIHKGLMSCDSCIFNFECQSGNPISTGALITANEYINRNKETKTFKEVISSIRKGEVWESSTMRVGCAGEQDNIYVENIDDTKMNRFTVLGSTVFRLVRTKYTTAQALIAYNEGKEIQNCKSGIIIRREDPTNTSSIVQDSGEERVFSNSDIRFTLNTLLEDSWFINE